VLGRRKFFTIGVKLPKRIVEDMTNHKVVETIMFF
jgi:hypothetical protein